MRDPLQSLLILSVLCSMITGRSTIAQDRQVIYDGQFDFEWQYYSGNEFLDTARIYFPSDNKLIRNRSTHHTGGPETATGSYQ